jgi:hypothetical protein
MSTHNGFLAIKSDGSASIWGEQAIFGNGHTIGSYDIILANHYAFLIQTDDELHIFPEQTSCDDSNSDEYGTSGSVICIPRTITGQITSFVSAAYARAVIIEN